MRIAGWVMWERRGEQPITQTSTNMHLVSQTHMLKISLLMHKHIGMGYRHLCLLRVPLPYIPAQDVNAPYTM